MSEVLQLSLARVTRTPTHPHPQTPTDTKKANGMVIIRLIRSVDICPENKVHANCQCTPCSPEIVDWHNAKSAKPSFRPSCHHHKPPANRPSVPSLVVLRPWQTAFKIVLLALWLKSRSIGVLFMPVDSVADVA